MNKSQLNEIDRQMIVGSADGRHNLPSLDYQETVAPMEDEEIHLRDYIDVIIRRKWVVFLFLFFIFFGTALFTLTSTPLFEGKGTLKASASQGQVTSFEDIQTNVLKSMEFQQTQVNLLESEQLAIRIIHKLDLLTNPFFNKEIQKEKDSDTSLGTLVQLAFSSVRNFIRFSSGTDEDVTQEGKERLLMDDVVKKLQEDLKISPVRNSELIQLSFESADPQLSSDVTNTAMEEFIQMLMDTNIQSSKNVAQFLEKQILSAQIKLEKSEKELNNFSRKAGLVSLDPKLNLIMRQLEELNDALAKARAERISKESLYQQAISKANQNLPQILQDDLIKNLKAEYSLLAGEYQDLSTTFKPAYPKMQQLKAKIDDITQRLREEKLFIIESIKNDYEAARKKQEYLEVKAEEQEQRAIELNDSATQYKILLRETETNKTIYESLLQRAKEIEASVGAAVTNITIVDRSRVPLYPSSPKVARNLLLGMLVGLFGGIGLAFFFEYLDDTIKNPEELIERFHISVLGLIPFDKECVDNRKDMALKSYTDPRSPVAESVRTAITSIDLSAAEHPPKTILVTSILPGAGKSSLSTNTALSYLSSGDNCLIIDVDLRKPSLHRIFDAERKGEGLSSVLSGISTLKEVIQKTDYKGLDYIASGPLPPNPAELVASNRMRELLKTVSEHYSHVILDAPPFQGFAEILVLANMVDGLILVTVEGDTPRDGVKHFRRSVLNVNGKILGAIVNKTGRQKGYGAYSKYSYYAYQYDYNYGEPHNGR
ncbi:MAG: polysaccharide biosynthesis tyrosine autokinase [Candidatus Electrothrix sp. LOE2]|jgi:capsular exopolysaccharide synthesis family protein|nr:polysaccharide biosynthesis tyrosine autokinase [Candidatus Electrothrix sp. LOE2]